MFKKLMNKKMLKNEKGLTLIELLAVIVILAIVAAIAIPAIGNIVNKSRDKAILAEASNILSGAKIAVTDGKCNGGSEACDGDALKDYVDGVTLTSGDIAAYDATNKKWSITYSRLSEVKLDDYKAGITSNKIDEDKLNANLKK